MPDAPRPWRTFWRLLGLFLSVRGYRSLEGDQAYRLPLLLHAQNPAVFGRDPFVRSFDAFNPHRGYLAWLDVLSRPAGLSPALLLAFLATFAVTFFGLRRLGRAVWGDEACGSVAAGLVFLAQAGNVGTNHLFEPILLDRMVAFGLGWLAIGLAVGTPGQGLGWSPWVVGVAALIHPTVGIQLAMLLAGFWAVHLCLVNPLFLVRGQATGLHSLPYEDEADAFTVRRVVVALGMLGVALVPGVVLNLGRSSALLDGLPVEDFRLLSVDLQGPQHMLPHLWRMPQWLAWGCYPVLAAVALLRAPSPSSVPPYEGGIEEGSGPSRDGSEPTPSDSPFVRGRVLFRVGGTAGARRRLLVVLGVNLAALALAWYGIERLHHLRLTLFQPFRMATVARGLCLVLVAGHCVRLWRTGSVVGRIRAVLIGVGLTNDWSLVVVTAAELTMSLMEAGLARWAPGWGRVRMAFGVVILGCGLVFLSRHDTEYGHVPLALAMMITPGLCRVATRRHWEWTDRRWRRLTAYAWVIPALALVANLIPEGSSLARSSVRQHLVKLCRFGEVPIDDVERIGLWCRDHVPPDARIVGPPGPKTLRLWSRRDVAFNRAGSPYNARGLADWSRRFADHVGIDGPPSALVSAYLRDRHGLEARYDALKPAERAALADRQGADYVIAPSPHQGELMGPLELLHVEGRYALYYRKPVDGPTLAVRPTRP